MTAPRHLPPEPYGDVLDKTLARVAELERENARLRELYERAKNDRLVLDDHQVCDEHIRELNEANDALHAAMVQADKMLAGR